MKAKTKGWAIKTPEGKLLPSWVHRSRQVIKATAKLNFPNCKIVRVEIREI